MPVTASILIPTFNHGPTLRFALQSILAQTVQDFEIFVVGDGVPDELKPEVQRLCQTDPRIQFCDYPKSSHRGEIYRDQIIRERASGTQIFYLSDDDLWLPHHLEVLGKALLNHDFVHSLHVNVFPGDYLSTQVTDLALPSHRTWLLNKPDFGFDTTFGAHTRSFYLALAHGWRPTPAGVNTDVYMWRQFVAAPRCRLTSIQKPTGFHFASPLRTNWTLQQRVDELARWNQMLASPTTVSNLIDSIFNQTITAAAKVQVDNQKEISQLTSQLQNTSTAATLLQTELTAIQHGLQLTKQSLSQLQNESQSLRQRLAAIESSLTWRLGSRLARLFKPFH